MRRYVWTWMAVIGLSMMSPACGLADRNGVLVPDATDGSIAQPEFSGSSRSFTSVASMRMPWGGLCTATLVAPNMMLTAAHCIYQNERFPQNDFASLDYEFIFTDANGMLTDYESSYVHVLPHSDASDDIVLVQLSSAVPLTPMPIMAEVSAANLGNNLGLVGYGEVKPGDQASLGKMHISGTNLDALSDNQIEYGSLQTSTSCFGDSGGPVIHQRVDGTYEIAGVVHGGSAACNGAAYASRADIHNAWIQKVIGVNAI